ncbi:MAG: transglycosylase SLT domain-containing protein [Deltaproteobacteria bacterium]|nr:transglycosylase SLT domain-containing protein [Deltaproteobacteria bacterium]
MVNTIEPEVKKSFHLSGVAVSAGDTQGGIGSGRVIIRYKREITPDGFFAPASRSTRFNPAGPRGFLLILLVLVPIFFAACATPSPPKRTDNICEIFRERPEWYDAAYASYQRWGVPIYVMMAIMHQESKYMADAKPPRTTCLCIFPGPRPSSAYGYAQAKDETWEEYQEQSGNSWADRDDFADAVDFVGWYCYLSYKQCKISRKNARSLYLAYHEGRGGFNRRTYGNKKWLLRVAARVQQRADRYRGQLAACEGEFRDRGGCCLWPF